MVLMFGTGFVRVGSVGPLRVGVGPLVGVEDLGVDLGVGVEDLTGGLGLFVTMVEEDLGVGVEDLEGLDVVFEVDLGTEFGPGLEDAPPNVGRPVGVAGIDPGPPEDVGLRGPPLEVFNPGDDNGCLDATMLLLFLPFVSWWEFDKRDFSAVGRALGVPIWLFMVLCDSDSSEGNRGVPGGVKSQS